MRPPADELRRLRDGALHEHPAGVRLSRQLRMLAGPGRLPTLGGARAGTRTARVTSVTLRLLLVLLSLVMAGGASATVGFLVRRWQQGATANPPRQLPVSHAPAPPGVASARTPVPVAALPPAAPLMSPPAAPTSSAPNVVHRTLAARAVPPLASHARSSDRDQTVPARGLGAEADLLRQALLVFRRGGQDREVLAVLDGYEARFPQGILALEARSMRAQVLLRLGDRTLALGILDGLPLAAPGQPPEMTVTRGELRSLSARCPEALLDFDRALGAAARLQPAERARALFGRASCRARTGDGAGAESDRQRYLREFPDGPAAGRLTRQPR